MLAEASRREHPPHGRDQGDPRRRSRAGGAGPSTGRRRRERRRGGSGALRDVRGALARQGMSASDLLPGDAIFFRYGWAVHWENAARYNEIARRDISPALAGTIPIKLLMRCARAVAAWPMTVHFSAATRRSCSLAPAPAGSYTRRGVHNGEPQGIHRPGADRVHRCRRQAGRARQDSVS